MVNNKNIPIKAMALKMLKTGRTLEDCHDTLCELSKAVTYQTLERYAVEEGLSWRKGECLNRKGGNELEQLIRQYFRQCKCIDTTAKKFGVGAWRVRQYTQEDQNKFGTRYHDSFKRVCASNITTSKQTVGLKS